MNPELINQSEVARLMQQIDLEVEACRRMFRDPAIVASHDAINCRMGQIGIYKDELAQHVPPDEAMGIVIAALERLDHDSHPPLLHQSHTKEIQHDGAQ